ncbi:hypothetical protein TNCV_2712491 [Trichonephila clavipes]|nr:hypothetical protein TNCV_2712491 [Trichonephila clavipes]
MNETTQQEKTTQLSSRNEQLNSAAGTNNSTRQQERNNSTLHCRRPLTTVYNRLQPPTTACTAFTAESALSTYLPKKLYNKI